MLYQQYNHWKDQCHTVRTSIVSFANVTHTLLVIYKQKFFLIVISSYDVHPTRHIVNKSPEKSMESTSRQILLKGIADMSGSKHE